MLSLADEIARSARLPCPVSRLHDHAAARARIAEGDDAYLGRFVQEVRRTAAFFPRSEDGSDIRSLGRA
jgi:hypothetical protein